MAGDTPIVKLSPSILAADQARLGEQVKEATEAGAHYIHVDVLDGRFAPNLSVGPDVVAAVRPYTHLPLDVHLMIEEPENLIPAFARAGSDILTVHAEACPQLGRTVGQIKELGIKAGVAINPQTPLAVLDEVLPQLDRVLLMTVNPGFPGQELIPAVLQKVWHMRRILDKRGLKAELGVDGGVKATNVPDLVKAGARVLAVGSAAFNKIQRLKEALELLQRTAQGVPIQ